MDLLICGSAASEAIPALFCKCPVCLSAREAQGKDMRSRVAYQLGESVRIDFGPDILMHQFKYDLRLEKLRHLFITHSHRDHFYPQTLGYRSEGFSNVEADNMLNLYGNATVLKMLDDTLKHHKTDHAACRLNPVQLRGGQPVEIPEEAMTVVPLPANHALSEEAFIFAIKKKGGQILLGTDSAYFKEEAWISLQGFMFNIVILDDTGCGRDLSVGGGHMGGKFVLDTVSRMKSEGMADERTVFVVNHFSHNGWMTHGELEKYFNPHGIQVAFDGMTLPVDFVGRCPLNL